MMLFYTIGFFATILTVVSMEPHWEKMKWSDTLIEGIAVLFVATVWPLFVWLCVYEQLDQIRTKLK